jgi:hypothetical protein
MKEGIGVAEGIGGAISDGIGGAITQEGTGIV